MANISEALTRNTLFLFVIFIDGLTLNPCLRHEQTLSWQMYLLGSITIAYDTYTIARCYFFSIFLWTIDRNGRRKPGLSVTQTSLACRNIMFIPFLPSVACRYQNIPLIRVCICYCLSEEKTLVRSPTAGKVALPVVLMLDETSLINISRVTHQRPATTPGKRHTSTIGSFAVVTCGTVRL